MLSMDEYEDKWSCIYGIQKFEILYTNMATYEYGDQWSCI